MAEVTNTNVFDATKRFIDLAGLDTFWGEAKKYIDNVDTTLDGKITGVANRTTALETTVNGTAEAEGLVKKVADLRSEMDSLGGGAGSVSSQIQNAIAALDLPNTYEAKGAAATAKSEVIAIIEENKETTANALTDLDTRVKVFEDMEIETAGAAEAVKQELQGVINGVEGRVAANEGAINGLKGLVGETSVDSQIKTAIQNFSEAVTDNKTVDTFAEVITYISEHGGEYNALVADVAKKAYAEDVYDKGEVDGFVSTLEGKIEAAKEAANGATTEALKDYYTKTEANGLLDAKADKATTYTKTDVDNKFAGYYTKGETDNIATGLEGKIAQALADAKADADAKLANYYKKSETYSQTEIDTKLAGYYTKTQIDTTLAGYYTKGETDSAISTALSGYYTKTNVDNKLTENSAADQTYARAYTDLLFQSVKFANTNEILGVFND